MCEMKVTPLQVKNLLVIQKIKYNEVPEGLVAHGSFKILKDAIQKLLLYENVTFGETDDIGENLLIIKIHDA